MRSLLCATALVTIALLGAGCKKGPDLVGKWSASQGAGTVDFEFKPDHTFTMGTKAGAMAISAKGDYKLDGEKLSLTTKDIDVPGLPPALLAQAKQNPEFTKPKDMTIKFVSDDEVSLSGNAPGVTTGKAGGSTQAVTLKRVKAS